MKTISRRTWLKSAPLIAMLAVGCGGAGYTEAFAVPGDGGPSTADGSSASGDGGTLDSSMGVKSDAAAGSIVADGGADPVGVGPGGTTADLPCGAATCAIPGQSCCVYELKNSAASFSYACVVGGTCPTMPNVRPNTMTCSGAANCATGTVCCVSDANGTVSSSCKAACSSKEAQLCDPRAMVTGCAAGAGACSSNQIGDWRLPKPYATCGGVGN